MTNAEKRQLYYALAHLRDQFKDYGRRREGRAPLVCTDDALYALVELCPKKIEDLYNVPEIGEHFVEHYGKDFIDLIKRYCMDDAEWGVPITAELEHILRELEKKLTSINKRNRLLYFSKLTTKTGADLSFIQDSTKVEQFLSGNKKWNIYNSQQRATEAVYRRCRQVSREANKEYRDKGQNNLYIGYPFVKGRLSGENFDVRAPLILFPVTTDATPEKITLSLDDSRDVQFNSALLLANYKFNNIKEPLPDVAIDDLKPGEFVTAAIDFYKDNYITIQAEDTDLIKFEEYKKETFPRYENGELWLEPCIVLGRYPVCDNAIQKDFEEILENGIINTLLEKLLEGVDIDDIEDTDDSYDGEFELPIDERELVISEHDLNYINDLNSSQEAVIKAANALDSLVVQGPPGTGKSQTIASLIADAATRGKTVLMVSEKKTALDVVYSRIGDLSKYALLIDDVTNKQLFYKQLDRMLTLSSHGGADANVTALNEISDDIDRDIEKLEKIADKLFAVDERIGIEPYKLYLENDKIDFEDENDRELAEELSACIDENILEWKYGTLNRCYEFFTRGDTLECCADIYDIYQNYPTIRYIREGLSTKEGYDLKDAAKVVKESVDEWQKKGFLSRFFSKGTLRDSVVNPFAKQYLILETSDPFTWVINNIENLVGATEQYREFHRNKPIYDNLSEEEHAYLESICKAAAALDWDLEDVNYNVYNYILFDYIDRFQGENRELLHTIANFNSVVQDISRLIGDKKKITRARLAAILAESAESFYTSKRGRDIRRAVDSKRRMSVNRFVNKYRFELFKYIKIWLLTPEVVSEIIPLENGIFDLVVFDEASQMYVEKGLPSILRAKKVIVAGDSKQLRPSSLGSGRLEISEEELPEEEDIPASLEEESLLDLAKAKYRDVLLNFHYRSKYEELIAFSNYAFYKAGLYVSPNSIVPKNPPIEVLKIDNGLWTKRANVQEAKKVVQLLKWILSVRKNAETIGIITFNVSQRDMIDDLIDEECAVDSKFAAQIRSELVRTKEGEDIGLFVKNIESVQGDERDIIIFSIGYAKNENGRIIRNFGWLNQKGGENRLNVAVSRAKKKVYIVTSINPEELQVEDALNNGPKYLKKYLQYAFAISKRDNATAKNILNSFGDQVNPGEVVSFDSIFEEQVYDALTEEGYEVDTQVGIGGYSIDLAIKYMGNYILGIECDGKLYHSSKSARERDYHRQKYLESRGWRIHRIWSTNWWNNSWNEIEKISRIVDPIIEAADKRKQEEERKKREKAGQTNSVKTDSSIDKSINRTSAKEATAFQENRKNDTIHTINGDLDFSTIRSSKKGVESRTKAKEATKWSVATKAPKQPGKRTITTGSGEKKDTKHETRKNYHDVYQFKKDVPNKQGTTSASAAKPQRNRSSDDEVIVKKCENCKFYRNEECAGLKLCENYQQVPGAK